MPVWCKIRLPLGGSRETLEGPLGKRSGRAASVCSRRGEPGPPPPPPPPESRSQTRRVSAQDPGDCSNTAAAPAVPGGGEETRLPQTRDLLPAAASRDPDSSPEPALGGAGRGTRSDGPGPCCARVRVHFGVLRPLIHVPLAITNVSGITGRMQEGKTLGLKSIYLIQINISSLHPCPGRSEWRQRGQRPGGPAESSSTRLVSKVPGPPLRKCGHLRVTLTSSESCSRDGSRER